MRLSLASVPVPSRSVSVTIFSNVRIFDGKGGQIFGAW